MPMPLRDEKWIVSITTEPWSDEKRTVVKKGITQLTDTLSSKDDDFLCFEDEDNEIFIVKKSLIQKITIVKDDDA